MILSRNRLWVVALLLGVCGFSASALAGRVSGRAPLPKVTPQVIAAGKTYGIQSAPVRIDEFSDLECPHCRNLFLNTLRPLIDQYVANGKVYLVHHDFPLPMHQYARQAAYYVDAAAAIGKLELVEQTLFLHQDQWSADGKIEPFVTSVLTPVQAKQVLELAQTSMVHDAVQQDVSLGDRLGINETPTMFITYKGRRTPIVGDVSYPILRGYIDALLRQ